MKAKLRDPSTWRVNWSHLFIFSALLTPVYWLEINNNEQLPFFGLWIDLILNFLITPLALATHIVFIRWIYIVVWKIPKAEIGRMDEETDDK